MNEKNQIKLFRDPLDPRELDFSSRNPTHTGSCNDSGTGNPRTAKKQILWYRRSGERVSAKRVAEVHAHAVHAKRYGYPASPYAPPGMSAQPTVADSLERMTDLEWSLHSGMFVSRIKQQ